jgi:hypothetical protein
MSANPKNVTKKQIKNAMKKENVLGKKSMSSAEYRRVMGQLYGFGGAVKGKIKSANSERVCLLDDIKFTYNVEVIDAVTVRVTLLGKHLSRNRVNNNLNTREKMRYKKMMKDSAQIFFLQNRAIKAQCKKWDRVKISYDIYNPRSRDTNGTDLKTFRDTFTIYGIILDDNRKVIPELPKQREIIDKEYKVIATITDITNVESA